MERPGIERAVVARAVHKHLRRNPEHVTHIPSHLAAVVYRITFPDETLLFKADAQRRAGRVVMEAWACDRVRQAGAPAPKVLALDLDRDVYPNHFALLTEPPGVPLATVPNRFERLLPAAGEMLALVHEITVTGFGLLDDQSHLATGRGHGVFDSWDAFLDATVEDALTNLAGSGLASPGFVDEVRARLDKTGWASGSPSLLHGDPDGNHILVEDDRVTGIVDFSERSAGDPAWDLARLYDPSDARVIRQVMQGYGGSDPGLIRRAGLCLALRSARSASDALERGDAGEGWQYLRLARQALSKPAA